MNDGYPEEEDLARIREWSHRDAGGLFEFVRSIWVYADDGYWSEKQTEKHGKPSTLYEISTAGWSGNEEVLGALRDNGLIWMMCWESTRRGGHYQFYGPPKPEEQPPSSGS